jgi:septum formation protein
LGIPFVAISLDADESELPGETPKAYLERIVNAKAELAARLADAHPALLVADTTVVLDGAMLQKPLDDDDNARMVRALAGRTHHVMTRFCVRARGGREIAETVTTAVTVRELSEREITGYVASGEGRDKAGGYAIQGLGAFAVTGISGSYSNVVGLPACEVVLACRALGVFGEFPLAPS